jgi:hypothetical protein
MATPEHRLITRIIQSGDLKEVLTYGIVEEDFVNLQCRAIWNSLHAYYRSFLTKGSIISEDAFRQTFSHFEFVEAPHMSTQALCHDLRTQKLTLSLKEAAVRAIEQAEDDPVAAAIALRQAADSISSYGSNTSCDVFFSAHITELLKTYELKESGQIRPVVRWPWDPLDEEVGGISEEDYVLFWGRPKSMKTFVLNYVMSQVYGEQEKRVLCYTKEMTPDNMLLRTAASMERLPYRETRLGKLDSIYRNLLFDLGNTIKERAELSNGRNDLIVLSGKDALGHDGVVWLQSKIEQYKPDICFVDGLYLLNDDRGSKKTADWQRVMHISRDVRQMILETRVPVVATMQANRAAAKNNAAELDEIAFADAVGQDITQGFRVINEKTSPTIALVAGGSREYQLHGIRIHGVPCVDFTFHSIMSEKEIAKAHRDDSTHDEPDNAAAHAKTRAPRFQSHQSTQASIMDEHINNNLKDL